MTVPAPATPTAGPRDRVPRDPEAHVTVIDLVLRCECGAEERAPADAVPGQVEDCASCGELMTVEVL